MYILGFSCALFLVSFTFRRQCKSSGGHLTFSWRLNCNTHSDVTTKQTPFQPLKGECHLLELSGALICQQRFSFVILQRPNGKTLSQYFDIIYSAQFEITKICSFVTPSHHIGTISKKNYSIATINCVNILNENTVINVTIFEMQFVKTTKFTLAASIR